MKYATPETLDRFVIRRLAEIEDYSAEAIADRNESRPTPEQVGRLWWTVHQIHEMAAKLREEIESQW